MFKILKQLGSILLLCTLLLSINSYVFADDYSDCVANTPQQAKTTCEASEQSFINTCSKDQSFEMTTYTSVAECLKEVQTSIDKCISDLNKKNIGACDHLKPTITTPPTIPNISTVVKPNVKDVSQVSPYLSSTFLPRVANTIVSFGIGAAVLGLILGAIGLLTAYGNDEKYGNAKKGIYFSLIGLIICLLAFAIVQLIFYTGYQAGQIR